MYRYNFYYIIITFFLIRIYNVSKYVNVEILSYEKIYLCRFDSKVSISIALKGTETGTIIWQLELNHLATHKKNESLGNQNKRF